MSVLRVALVLALVVFVAAELPHRRGKPFQADRDRARATHEAAHHAAAKTGGAEYPTHHAKPDATHTKPDATHTKPDATHEKDHSLRGLPGNFGVDMAVWTSPSESTWRCMRTQGNYTIAILEGWNGGRGMRTDIGAQVGYAWNAGMHKVELYSFMCPRCGNTVESVAQLAHEMNAAMVKKVWLDIEDCTGCWNDAASNVAYIGSLADAFEKAGIKVGIYTSTGEWAQVTGNTGKFSDKDLWYAHYDGNPSFSDFHHGYIGGWSSPTMKQFADSANNACGTSVDRDWQP
jgi:hypothetical protein